jgi:predicted urease superfamily metal-dependent hydrolase
MGKILVKNSNVPKLALTREETAQAIGVHPITISRLTERGLLRPSRATRRPLYSIEELQRFLRDTASKPVEAGQRCTNTKSKQL